MSACEHSVSSSYSLSAALLGAVSALTSCHVQDVASLTSETTSPADSSSSSTSDGTTTTTSSADTTEGPPEACAALGIPVECFPFPAPEGTYTPDSFVEGPIDISANCPCALESFPEAGGLNGNGSLFAIYVDHPAGWPTDPPVAPLVVFSHGENQAADAGYDFSGLAAAGFVVLNVETEDGGGSSLRDFALACGIEWAATHWDHREGVDCNLVVAGHSRGGDAAGGIVRDRHEEPWATLLAPYGLRGSFLLAPGYLTVESTPPADALPMLVIASAVDHDVGSGEFPITWYDLAPPEDDFSSTEVGKALVYSWGTNHDAFGGIGSEFHDTGAAIRDGYVTPFVRASVYRDSASVHTWWSYLTRETYPSEVLDPEIWDHVDPFARQSPVDCANIALADCAETPGCEESGSDCVDVACDQLASNACDVPGCVLSSDDECMDLPRLRTSYTVDQHPPTGQAGARREVAFFEDLVAPEYDSGMTIAVDEASTVLEEVVYTYEATGTGHQTAAMLVQWGGTLGDPGTIALQIPDDIDLTDYSHLSMRVGNIIDKTSETTPCAVASTDAVSFGVGLRERVEGTDLVLAQSALLSTGRIVQNDYGVQGLSGSQTCNGLQTMNTIRFPLDQLCSGLGSEALAANEIVLSFPARGEDSRVLVDTIELTRGRLDEPAVCGTLAAGWRCEVDELTVEETACSGEPTPACDGGDVTTTPLLAPLVDLPEEDPFRGWYVFTPRGSVVDPENPTETELARVRERCVSACELEYADDPHVAADCSAAGAFLESDFVTVDAHASRYQIPAEQVNGGGLFEEETLACDLRVDCCEQFDEDVCPQRLARVTEARQGLGHGEEWLYGMEGYITIDSDALAEPVVGTLVGTLGGSLCTAGNDEDPCPIYIGSATVELEDPVTVVLSCGGQPVTHVLESLELALAQPAFGIMSEEFEVWSAFPTGGLVFDAHTVVDDLEFDTFMPIEEGVGMMFDAGWAIVPAYAKFDVTLDVPCNGDIVEVESSFELIATSWLGSPPEAEITVASEVECPTSVALTVSTSDVENDVDSIRWLVDGVLIDSNVTTLPFTQAHDLTAIVRDGRGATTTVRKHVACG